MENRKYRAYRKRNEILKELGYESYQKYLESPLWYVIRTRVLEARGEVCGICGNRGTTCHHQIYTKAVLQGTKKGRVHIIVLCNNCHSRIEIDKDGNKRDLHEVHKALKGLKVYYRYGKIRGKHQ